ncbi:MAG: hypothetical protein AAFN10_28390 [Bacteroidota bacterium]
MKSSSLSLFILLIAIGLFVSACSEEYADLGKDNPVEECVERGLKVEKGTEAFYEIIDRKGKEVWGTWDFTAEDFEALKIPLFRRTAWFKNSAREGFVDTMQFMRSPGCPEDGMFTYKEMYGRDWLKVVELIEIRQKIEGTDGLLEGNLLIKYHRVKFYAGKTVFMLSSPDGEQYISLTRDVNRDTDSSSFPDNWSVSSHTLTKDLPLDLFGEVLVIRVDNGDSYQGPLADDFDIEEYTQ